MKSKKLFTTLLVSACMFVQALMPVGALAAEQETEVVESTVKTITLSAAGDCTLGVDSRYNNRFNEVYKKNNNEYFLKKVKDIFAEDDVTIVNFEGTLTESNARAVKKFTFKGPAKYAQILVDGNVDVVTLANNHTLDFGKKGFDDTKANLKKKNIPFCTDTMICYKTIDDVKLAFLGFKSDVTKTAIKNKIAEAKKNNAQIIIVSVHKGVEGDYNANSSQKSLYRYAIDQGASLVLGHHPHVLQGIEEYKGRYIVYSLGNFCFGGNRNPKDKDTMIFQQTFYVKDGKLTAEKDAKVIPCSLSGQKNANDFQPHPLSGSEKKRVITKLNKLSKGMHININADGKITYKK